MRIIFWLIFLIGIVQAQFKPRIIESTKEEITTIDTKTLLLERGKIAVPNSRRHPSYTIIIPYYRIFSFSGNPASPVFYLAGGPGTPGIPGSNSYQKTYAEAFAQQADVVFFDQRGSGQSSPDLSFHDALDIPVQISISAPEFWPLFVEQICHRIQHVVDEKKISLDDYNTFENANDLDDLRNLLGYKKITLWGHSYGSHLGFAYINQFEEHVDKAVFSGVNGLNDRYRLPSESDAALERFNNYIQKDPNLNQRIADFGKLVKEIISDLRKAPKMVNMEYKRSFNPQGKSLISKIAFRLTSLFKDSIAVEIGEFEFKAFLMFMIQEANNLYNVPQTLLQIKNGDYRPVARLVKPLINQGGKQSLIAKTAMTYSMSMASHAAAEKLQKIHSEIEANENYFSGVLNFPFIYKPLQGKLKITYLPGSFRETRIYKTPVLFINGDLDVRTPLEHVNRNASLFPNSTVFVVKKASHTLYNLDDRIMKVMTEFFSGRPLSYDSITIRRSFTNPDEIIHRQKLSSLFSQHNYKAFEEYARVNIMEITEFTLNAIGYIYMDREEYYKAKAIFKLNVQMFPDASNPYDSLGEAYYKLGDYEHSAANYKESIKRNRMNRNAFKYLQRIEEIKLKMSEE